MCKNPDLSVLRVAVVPTETGNGISQDSTSKNATIFTYFKG